MSTHFSLVFSLSPQIIRFFTQYGFLKLRRTMWMSWNTIQTYHIFQVDIFFSCVHNIIRVIIFEHTHLYFVEINGNDKGSFCGLHLIFRGGVMGAYISSVNAESSKYHNREKSNIRIFLKEYNVLCQPWSIRQKMNASNLLLGRLWPYLNWKICN